MASEIIKSNNNLQLWTEESLKSLPTCKTITDVFNSKCPNISSKSYNQKDLFKFISDECCKFLNINSASENNEDIAFQFAEDITETRLDWKPTDIVMFFKTIRQRQDIEEFQVLGNKITGIKLSEMIMAYEELRADQFEVWNKTRWTTPNPEIKVSEVGLKTLAEIKSRLFKEPQKSGTPEESEQNNQVQQWIKDFDRIRAGSKFGEVNGQMMNIDDYLKYKIETNNVDVPESDE